MDSDSEMREVPNLDALAQKVSKQKAKVLNFGNRPTKAPPKILASSVVRPRPATAAVTKNFKSATTTANRAPPAAAIPAIKNENDQQNSVTFNTNRQPQSAFRKQGNFAGAGAADRSRPYAKRQHNENYPSHDNKRPRFGEGQGQGTDEKTNWKALKQEKKDLKAARKKAEKGGDIYSIEHEAKQIWEDLRRKDCLAEKQQKLSLTLYNLIKAHLPAMIKSHDMSRVIQTMMAKGTTEMRGAVISILSVTPSLAWTKYSNHVISKAITHGTMLQKKEAYRILMPHFSVMMTQPKGRDMAELIFEGVNTDQHRLKCISTVFGPTFRATRLIEKNQKLPFPTAVEWGKTSDRHQREMKAGFQKLFTDMFQRVNPISLKYHMVHFFLVQYFSLCTTEEQEAILEELKIGENFPEILTTKSGSTLVMNFFWNSTPKVRKVMVKSLKGKVCEIASKQFGHLVLLAILDSLDDTTLASKVIITELLRNISTVMESLYGRKVVRYLVDRRNRSDFSPEMIAMLSKGDTNEQSKKDTAIRCEEILNASNDDLLNAVIENAKAWLANSQYASVVGSILSKCHGSKLEKALNEIVKEITEEPTLGTIQNGGTFMLVKKLIGQSGNEAKESGEETTKELLSRDTQERNLIFTKALVKSFTKESMANWLESPQGCALLQLILNTWDIEEIRKELIEKIKLCPYLDILEKDKSSVKKVNLLEALQKYLSVGQSAKKKAQSKRS